MSYAALILFDKDGNAAVHEEYKNSWGGSALVWASLCEEYGVTPRDGEYDPWSHLWERVKDGSTILKPFEKVVLYFTYDNALVKAENFEKLADALREFWIAHQKPTRANHLDAWSRDLRKLPEGTQAIGLWATSVCECPWTGFDEEEEKHTFYNLAEGEKHWFIFDELEKDES